MISNDEIMNFYAVKEANEKYIIIRACVAICGENAKNVGKVYR